MGTKCSEDDRKALQVPVPYRELPNLHDLEYHRIATVHDATDGAQYFFLDGIKYSRKLHYSTFRHGRWKGSDKTIRIGSSHPPTADFCVRNVRLLRGVSGGEDSGEHKCREDFSAKLDRYYNA